MQVLVSNTKMKDLIKRISISIVSWTFIGYIVFLWMNNMTIVTSEFANFNTVYYIWILIAWLFLFVMFGVYPIHMRLTKATLFAIWILMLFVWNYFLVNDPSQSIFVWDIVKVFWVLLSLLAWTNVLITDKVKKKWEDATMEVIEV